MCRIVGSRPRPNRHSLSSDSVTLLWRGPPDTYKVYPVESDLLVGQGRKDINQNITERRNAPRTCPDMRRKCRPSLLRSLVGNLRKRARYHSMFFIEHSDADAPGTTL